MIITLFSGCAILRAPFHNDHGSRGWWSVWESYSQLTERKIKIPAYVKPHLVEYIALQMEAMDDEQLQNDLNAY
jgi:hypothetical protein